MRKFRSFATELRNATMGRFGKICARAANGKVATAAQSVMKSRRLIYLPRAENFQASKDYHIFG
jgi:hypothetical protein